MHRAMLLMAMLLGAGPALGETPAERASRALNREIARDRAQDAAEAARDADTARAAPAPAANAAAQGLEADRATIRPDVGRPEASGGAAGTLRSTGEDGNVTR